MNNNNIQMPNLFERNPKKTILLILMICFLIIVFALEAFLEWKNSSSEKPGIVRYIRLRENPPGTIYPISPNELYMITAVDYKKDKHRLKVDENGFIYPSRIHEKPDVTIVFLGGSTTECLYVEEEKRFPYLVGRFLEQRNLKVNSYNGGVAGNDTLHSMNVLINKVFRFHPDIVVIMHNINDLSVLMGQKTYWHNISTRGVIIEETPTFAFTSALRQLKNKLIPNLYIKTRNFVNRMKLLQKEEREFARCASLPTEKEKSVMINNFGSNLQSLIYLCRARNITPVLMTMESRLTENPNNIVKGGAGNLPPMSDEEYESTRKLFFAFNETIRDVGKKNNILVIDLAKKIPQEPQYIYDVIHFTDYGSESAAKIIAGELKPYMGKKVSPRGQR